MNESMTPTPERLRHLVLRTNLKLLRTVGLTMERWSPGRSDREPDEGFVLYRGLRLPPKRLRGRMCGDAFRVDRFYLLSAILEATKFAPRVRARPGARIVDIGSGLGRLATGLLAECGAVDYLGIDANREFVQWCQAHIQQQHPSYAFVHLDMANALYNPAGSLDGRHLRLPVADGSADVVNLWGVFTNMVPEDVEAFVAEIARILAPQGQCFLTAFVEDDVPDVSFNPSGYVPYACTEPLTVVRYSRGWMFSTFQRHGLEVQAFRYHGSMFPNQSEIELARAAAPGVH